MSWHLPRNAPSEKLQERQCFGSDLFIPPKMTFTYIYCIIFLSLPLSLYIYIYKYIIIPYLFECVTVSFEALTLRPKYPNIVKSCVSRSKLISKSGCSLRLPAIPRACLQHCRGQRLCRSLGRSRAVLGTGDSVFRLQLGRDFVANVSVCTYTSNTVENSVHSKVNICHHIPYLQKFIQGIP